MMNLRIQRPFTSTPRRQEGSVSVLMVISLAAMAMMAALALDGGHMMLNKTRLQNAVDAAALSGAKTLSQVESGINSVSAANTTRTAALNTLIQNANATGNNELATAVSNFRKANKLERQNYVDALEDVDSFNCTRLGNMEQFCYNTDREWTQIVKLPGSGCGGCGIRVA